jgi:hypothetical protein
LFTLSEVIILLIDVMSTYAVSATTTVSWHFVPPPTMPQQLGTEAAQELVLPRSGLSSTGTDEETDGHQEAGVVEDVVAVCDGVAHGRVQTRRRQ